MSTPLRRMTTEIDDEFLVVQKQRPNSCVGIYSVNHPTSLSLLTRQMSNSSHHLPRKYRVPERSERAIGSKRTRLPAVLRVWRCRHVLLFGSCTRGNHRW